VYSKHPKIKNNKYTQNYATPHISKKASIYADTTLPIMMSIELKKGEKINYLLIMR
jgi:hypothetical protein